MTMPKRPEYAAEGPSLTAREAEWRQYSYKMDAFLRDEVLVTLKRVENIFSATQIIGGITGVVSDLIGSIEERVNE